MTMAIQEQITIKPYRLYRFPEVAEILGVSIPGVRRLVDDGDLKVKRVGKTGHSRVVGQSIIDFTSSTNTTDSI